MGSTPKFLIPCTLEAWASATLHLGGTIVAGFGLVTKVKSSLKELHIL